MKKAFEDAKLELFAFANEDVIVTSDQGNSGSGGGSIPDPGKLIE